MIVQLVKSIAEALPVTESPNTFPTFKHGEKEWQNFIADELEGVLIFLDEPITSEDSLKPSGYIEESYPVSILFASKSELDWTPEQHQVVHMEMRALTKRFVHRLSANENVRHVVMIGKTYIKNIYDINLSGVILRIKITPFNPDSVCP